MKILISNDDGVESPGIKALAEAVKDLGEVFVVAPHRERSTAGHSLTLHKPLRIQDLGNHYFSTSGTPADCVYLGIREVVKGRPDVILSGINRGANLGTDLYYSGTVAAAREGALMNIRSYAFSLVDMAATVPNYAKEPLRFDMAAKIAKKVLQATLSVPFPSHSLLNVNIPNVSIEKVKGLKVARQGFRYYKDEVTKRKDPRGRDYYWIGGPYERFEEDSLSDCHWIEQSYVSMVPIHIDCTHNEFYTTLKRTLHTCTL
ncbi:MAG: 5'/3'-nucleotidase SurE [Deltaproteobacteria bacterium]|nr:5'/3'-nucleotidase SurE [Deltaproteobacteria bacterium]